MDGGSQPDTGLDRTGAARLSTVSLGPWFDERGRDLPWRQTRDPWAILVAEVMLQQTQVDRVIGAWQRFLQRFPSAKHCARATPAQVIEHWRGLGYNRRAVRLHAAAVAVVDRHQGRLPATVAELRQLPGVGPYTARAVAVFAFEQSEAVLDTNVARILARVEGRSLGRTEAQRLADQAVAGRDPWLWNQALLDVGAGLCRSSDPGCHRCPLNQVCCWYRAGRPPPDPAVSSAAVSKRQSTFEGSDRQGRGRLVEMLRRRSVAPRELAQVMGWPDDPGRAHQVAATVIEDGLAVVKAGRYRLPG